MADIPKVGEVYERGGERRTVNNSSPYVVSYYFDTPNAYGATFDWREEWDRWVAGATLMSDEQRKEVCK